jgi:hypothetical protein
LNGVEEAEGSGITAEVLAGGAVAEVIVDVAVESLEASASEGTEGRGSDVIPTLS